MSYDKTSSRHQKNGGDLDNTCVVYRHIRTDKNEPFYIGIGKNISRAYSKKNRNKYWYNIVSKVNFEIEILFEGVSWEFAKKKEKEFIALYGRRDLSNGTLCNMTDGGDGCAGNKMSEEARNKIREARKGKKRSKQTIERIRQGHIGNKHSEETKNKMSIAKSKKVLHIKSGNIYKSLKCACKELHLNYNTELSRIHNNSNKLQFKYI